MKYVILSKQRLMANFRPGDAATFSMLLQKWSDKWKIKSILWDFKQVNKKTKSFFKVICDYYALPKEAVPELNELCHRFNVDYELINQGKGGFIINASVAPEDFEKAFKVWFDKCNDMLQEYLKKEYPSGVNDAKLEASDGKRYIKIIKIGKGERSAWAFIDKTNGDVLKAAGWNTPAKGKRGNIFDEHGGMKSMSPYGPAYLR